MPIVSAVARVVPEEELAATPGLIENLREYVEDDYGCRHQVIDGALVWMCAECGEVVAA